MSKQMEVWSKEFGDRYTDRNSMGLDEYDNLFLKDLGVSRTSQINEFLSNINVDRILEVGSNIGIQLLYLRRKGFKKLYGIEINRYAIEKSKEVTNGRAIDIIEGSALDIPFKDDYFDLVFTSEALIHISPNDINQVLDEIYRTTKKYIWGSEFYSEKYTEVNYRGYNNLLWKTNFAQLYLDRFPDLKLIKEKKYHFLEDDNLINQVFLIQKS